MQGAEEVKMNPTFQTGSQASGGASDPVNQAIRAAMGLHQSGRLIEAKSIYEEVLRAEPRNAHALHWLGIIAHQAGQHEQAISMIARALDIDSDNASYHCSMGMALKAAGHLEAAVASYGRATDIRPDFADAFYNCANALRLLGRLEAALASYDSAIRVMPDHAEAYSNRGLALHEMVRPGEAVSSYDRAIEIWPDYVDARYNRGIALMGLGQLPAALSSFDGAIKLQPKHADAYSNRGIVLAALGRMDEALASYDVAIGIRADHAHALYNRGNLLQKLGQIPAAIASYDRAIAADPANASHVRGVKGLALLLTGNFRDGWKNYEWRWHGPELANFRRTFVEPQWTGHQELSGKTILLHSEQGLGDTIQFCRYIELVVALGASVILEVQRPLLGLFRNFGGVTALLAHGDPLPYFDYHCPLLSLPLAFHTDLASIPCRDRYLRADALRASSWKARLGGDGFKVGICWQGRVSVVDIGRSFPLSYLKGISQSPKVQLFSLQKNYGQEQLSTLPAGMHVVDLGSECDGDGAFIDTAAVMENLDLIITSDTAIAHLAGALGCRVWVALKFVPDWRWMLQGERSPWYPSMTLYRQDRAGHWQGVFDKMERDIRSFA